MVFLGLSGGRERGGEGSWSGEWGAEWVMGSERGDAPLPPTEIGSLLPSFTGAVVVDGALSAMGGAASGTAMAGKCGGESRDGYCGANGFFGR